MIPTREYVQAQDGAKAIAPKESKYTDASEAPLQEYFDALHGALGAQGWWPGWTRFEVIMGAILTQSTSWSNVEKTIANLRRARALTPKALGKMRTARLAKLIRSSGYYRQKAKKLKSFVRFLERGYGGSLKRMFRRPATALREELLAVHGIGPETADSILLYAGGRAVFVVDAYTRRIMARHGWAKEEIGYEPLREMFEKRLPRDARLYNEFHALLVATGKQWCRPADARCGKCPLGRFLEEGR